MYTYTHSSTHMSIDMFMHKGKLTNNLTFVYVYGIKCIYVYITVVQICRGNYKFHEICTREAWTMECFHLGHAVWDMTRGGSPAAWSLRV